MKHFPKILLGSLLLTGALFVLNGCVADGRASEGVYYGPHRDPWFRDDPWMDSDHRWYHDDSGPGVQLYIHPPRYRH